MHTRFCHPARSAALHFRGVCPDPRLSMTRLTVSALCLLMVCLWASPARAQDRDVGVDDPPAHISVVEGAAILERDGRSESDLASMPLLAGDRLRTQGGRVEVLFADGSAL